jgi:uncharacterized protein involved in outer membrane biogenesis
VKRRLLTALAIGGLVGVAVLVVGVLSLNRLVEANRQRILEYAAEVVGRPVSVGSITVSLWGGLGVRLAGVSLADEPQFGDPPLLRADAITGRADLLPLLRGDLLVSRVDLDAPTVNIVRDATGAWNFAGLRPQPRLAATVPPVPPPASPSLAIAALVAEARIRQGTVLVTDRGQPQYPTMHLTQLEASLQNISEHSPIDFRLAGALNRDSRNLDLTGSIGPVDNPSSIPVTLRGRIGPLGPHAVEFDDVRLDAVVAPDAIVISTLSGTAFRGSVTLSARVPRRDDADATLRGTVADLDLAPAVAVAAPHLHTPITGTATVHTDLHATGMSADAIRGSLAGNAELTVTDGIIQDFNLVNEVLGKITGLPGISSLVSATVKPKYRHLFEEPNTHLDRLHGTFQVADQRLHTDDLTIAASDYGARLRGWVAFDRQADLSGELFMSKRFSDDAAADVKEVRALLDKNGQLTIPFRLRGRLGEAKPEPELGPLIRALTEGAAGSVLNELLGGSRPGATPRIQDLGRALERGVRNLFGH